MKRRKQALTDQVTVTINEARHVLGMGPKQFRRVWTEYYQFEVRHVLTTNGTKLLLVDMIRAAYPELQDDAQTAHLMAQEYMWRLQARRSERHPHSIVNRRKREDGEEVK